MNADPLRGLTEAQKVVLRLAADGYDSEQIAGRLGISKNAVDDRFARARAKFDQMPRRSLARLVVTLERAHPTQWEATPDRMGGGETPAFSQIQPAAERSGLNEERSPFDHSIGLRQVSRLNAYTRSALIVASAFALLMLVALLKPASDGLGWIGRSVGALL